MKKLLLIIAICLSVRLTLAQSANINGVLYAAQFGQWTMPTGQNGSYAWSGPGVCVVNSGGLSFQAFTVGTPVTIVDANPAHTETVTPSVVNSSGIGCSIQFSPAPSYTHYSYQIKSGTAGLQEAINWALRQPNFNGLVELTPQWSQQGGTTGMITSARGSSTVSIFDFRTAQQKAYTWNGSAYVQVPIDPGSASLTGDNVFTGTNYFNGPALHLLNELSPTYPCPTHPEYPLGCDLTGITRGSADSNIFNYALEVTATNSCGPGVCSFTVTSPTLNGVSQAGNPTALFADSLIDTNLRIALCDTPCVPGQGTWENLSYAILDGTHIQVTAAQAHTTPKIRQQGVHFNKGYATIYKADPTGFYADYSVEDANFTQAYMINLVSGGSWPQTAAIKFPTAITGFNNTTRDFVYRQHDATSRFVALNAANTAQLFKFDNSGNTNIAGTLNVSNTIGSVTGDADNNLSISAGNGGAIRGVTVAFEENGVNKWSIQKSTATNLIFTDAANSMARMVMVPNSTTSIESAGTGQVRFNDVANSGTGGFAFYGGGASPTQVATIDSLGHGSFNGGVGMVQTATTDYTQNSIFQQGLNPSANSTASQFGPSGELFTLTANSKTFSGSMQGIYGSSNHFGSGNHTGGIYGGAFEGFNDGPATATLVAGVSGNANCGGVAAGNPVQTPTNNGNCTNLRAITATAKNLSSGTVTNAEGIYVNTPVNSGGGTITNTYGVYIADQTVGTNKWSLFAGLGTAEFTDVTQVDKTMGIGQPASTSEALTVFSNAALTGTTQTGIKSLPKTSTAATIFGIGGYFRADTVASSFTQTNNAGVYIANPTKGASSTITHQTGLYIEDQTVGGTDNRAIKTLGNAVSEFGGGIQTSASASGSANHAVCWKDTTHLGYCSDVVASDGTCTCN
jgi:hypothetical protein